MAQVRRIHLWKLKSNFSSHHSNWTLAFWPLYLVPPHNCRQLCHVADFPALMEGGVTIKYNGVNLCKLKVETLETSQNWKKRTTQSLGAFLKSKKFPPKNYATISGSLVKDRFMNLLGAWVWREPWHCKELERDWTSSCLAFAIWVQHSRWMSISKWLNPQVVLFVWLFFFFRWNLSWMMSFSVFSAHVRCTTLKEYSFIEPLTPLMDKILNQLIKSICHELRFLLCCLTGKTSVLCLAVFHSVNVLF